MTKNTECIIFYIVDSPWLSSFYFWWLLELKDGRTEKCIAQLTVLHTLSGFSSLIRFSWKRFSSQRRPEKRLRWPGPPKAFYAEKTLDDMVDVENQLKQYNSSKLRIEEQSSSLITNILLKTFPYGLCLSQY